MATKAKSKKTTAPKKVTVKKSATGKSRTTAAAVVSKTKAKTRVNAPKLKPFKVKKSQLVTLLVILVAAALIYTFRSVIVAATVNGQAISRLSVVKEAEKQAGKQALDSLVRNTLIEQEAKKQKVTVSEKEIDAEIKKAEASLSKQGRKMDEVLALQGLTRVDLRKLIRLDKMVTKMVGKTVTVSDKEVSEYIEQNRENLPADQTEEELTKSVKAQLTQQALSTKVQEWLANLQKKAKINYFVSY